MKASSKFQITIPKEIREAVELKPGENLKIYLLDKSIRIGSKGSIKDFKGIAKGMIWKEEYRDRNDRF